MSLETRRLGHSNLAITTVAIGCRVQIYRARPPLAQLPVGESTEDHKMKTMLYTL